MLMRVAHLLCVLSTLATAGVRGEEEVGTDEEKYEYPKIGQAPYVAAVTSKAGVCTGTIINKEWVLTAAHCLYSKNKVIGQRDARVLAGVVDYDMPQQFSKQETQSQEVHVHPRFWHGRIAKYDVALIRVRDEFQFNDWVGSIRVSGEGWPQPTEQRDKDLDVTVVVNDTLNCMWLGYGGYKSTSPATTRLKQLNVTAGHGERACAGCPLPFQRKRLVCVKEQLHSMTCRGDDGGPLVCDKIVRAVVHMTWNRATCDQLEYPLPKCQGGADRALTTFSFLCPYNDWLHSVVADIPPRPESCLASALARPQDLILLSAVAALALSHA